MTVSQVEREVKSQCHDDADDDDGGDDGFGDNDGIQAATL